MPACTAQPTAWINGEFLPLASASLSVLDAGVTGGVTVTERLRTFRHEPFLLDEHLDRLAASAQAAYLKLPLPLADLRDIVDEVAQRTAIGLPAGWDMAISVFLTAGTAAGSTLCVHAAPVAAAQYAPQYDGISLAIPPTRALPADCFFPHIKTRSRLHWHIADRQAAATEPGAAALLVDLDGFVTETATGNLFAVLSDGSLVTPNRGRTLRGISQGYVFRLAQHLGVGVAEADLTPADLRAASELFTTSSVSCMLPVVWLDRVAVGGGEPGPVYRQFLSAWGAAVGVNIAGQMRDMAAGSGS